MGTLTPHNILLLQSYRLDEIYLNLEGRTNEQMETWGHKRPALRLWTADLSPLFQEGGGRRGAVLHAVAARERRMSTGGSTAGSPRSGTPPS